MKRIALIALSLFFAGGGFCATPAANSGDDQLQKLAQDFWNWRARLIGSALARVHWEYLGRDDECRNSPGR